MDELINDFIAETREMLEALGGEIIAWEAAPQDRARLDEIFRFVHTVKGNCGFFDLPRLESLSHAAEDVLAEVRAGKRAADNILVSAVLAIIDRIGELVQALETGEAVSSADDDQLIAALSQGAGAAPAPSPHAAAGGEARKTFRSIRLPIDLLDRMMSGVSDLVLARNELARRLREAPGDVAVNAAFDRASACIAEMREAITRTRMQRIDNLFISLPRMVRDLAAELGKSVSLDIDGGDVELDREMIEMIRDPLTHIVRNAVDHGIETPVEREMQGKSTCGTLRICAHQSGNQILIEIADDGRGLDTAKLVAKAVASGLISTERADRLGAAQKAALIFEPGLTTATEVSAISGRGVGMDVVRANIERIGGVVDIETKQKEGLRLTLRVPLTLTIIPALTLSVAGQNYAIPRSAIEEIVRGKGDAIRVETLGGSGLVTIRDRRLPIVSLADVLGVAGASLEERTLVVLKPAGSAVYALEVDLVHDHEELVVKPAAPLVMATGLYAGTTLADDGRPILLLDAAGIAAAAGVLIGQGDAEKRAADAAKPEGRKEAAPALLFRTLDGRSRAVHLAVVERIEDVLPHAIQLTGGRFHVALGDRIVPLAGTIGVLPSEKVRILRLTDGAIEVAYAFAEVLEIVSIDGDVTPAAAPGEVAGVTLIGGVQVELLDPHWLFASVDAGIADTGRPLCLLPSDPWSQNFLRPLVESAGYRVLPAALAESEQADLVIDSGGECAARGDGCRVIRIRSSMETEGKADDSIYRYDRAALLAALRAPTPERKRA
jgi:two-component system chemotaxis sensor kinase CheA